MRERLLELLFDVADEVRNQRKHLPTEYAPEEAEIIRPILNEVLLGLRGAINAARRLEP